MKTTLRTRAIRQVIHTGLWDYASQSWLGAFFKDGYSMDGGFFFIANYVILNDYSRLIGWWNKYGRPRQFRHSVRPGHERVYKI